MKAKTIKLYYLYSIDSNGQTKFIGKFASKHRLHAAIVGLGLGKYFYETEDKECEWGGTIRLTK